MCTPRPVSAFSTAGSVATSVLPSPVFISAILPSFRTMPPINCTSKWRMPSFRRPASRTKANAGTSAGSSASLQRSLNCGSSRGRSPSRACTCVRSCTVFSRSSASLSFSYSGASALISVTSGWISFRSRSCFVPMNRATTRSIKVSTRITILQCSSEYASISRGGSQALSRRCRCAAVRGHLACTLKK